MTVAGIQTHRRRWEELCATWPGVCLNVHGLFIGIRLSVRTCLSDAVDGVIKCTRVQ